MKKIIYIIAVILITIAQKANSQQIGNLNGIYYQAVAVDETGKEIVGTDINGKPLYNMTISVRFTITKGLNGTTQWQETHAVTTDRYGLFSLVIGKGTPVGVPAYSKLLDLPWIDADQFLKVEISTKNDGSYKLVSNQQFMTVPYSFYTDDIADNAITTAKILDRTILNNDIADNAITTAKILDGTILNNDIADNTITTAKIFDGTILNNDIADNTIATSKIADGTILNNDIAGATIDLTTKITNILPVANGGTGKSVLTENTLLVGNGADEIQSMGLATDGQIPIGVTGGSPVMANITAGTGVTITNSAGGIQISSAVSEITSDPAGTFVIGNLPPGSTYTSNAINAFAVNFGDVIIGSIDANLQGCMLTAYVSQQNVIRISIFNGTGGAVNLGTVNVRVLIVH